MPQLSTLPTNSRFRAHGKPFTKLAVLAWDALRDNPDHDLFGVDPQIAPRPDAVHVVSDDGLLVLMRPDVDVEPLPAASEYAYRVTVGTWGTFGSSAVFGAISIDDVRSLIRSIGIATVGDLLVAIEHDGKHINADGTLCREQGNGLQWRAVEARVQIGSVSL